MRHIPVQLAVAVFVAALGAAPVADPVKDAPKPPEGGKVVDGLQLTLSADTTKTVQKVDPPSDDPKQFPGGGAEPIKLTLTFTNVSQKPIKLNTFQMDRGLVKLDVSDPDSKEVGTTFASKGFRGQIALIEPKDADFPVIEPGKKWSMEKSFPGVWANLPLSNAHVFVLKQPGSYKVSFTYENKKSDAPVAANAWTGKATSNELTVTVKPASK